MTYPLFKDLTVAELKTALVPYLKKEFAGSKEFYCAVLRRLRELAPQDTMALSSIFLSLDLEERASDKEMVIINGRCDIFNPPGPAMVLEPNAEAVFDENTPDPNLLRFEGQIKKAESDIEHSVISASHEDCKNSDSGSGILEHEDFSAVVKALAKYFINMCRGTTVHCVIERLINLDLNRDQKVQLFKIFVYSAIKNRAELERVLLTDGCKVGRPLIMEHYYISGHINFSELNLLGNLIIETLKVDKENFVKLYEKKYKARSFFSFYGQRSNVSPKLAKIMLEKQEKYKDANLSLAGKELEKYFGIPSRDDLPTKYDASVYSYPQY